MTSPRPTNRTYASLEAAYDHFNRELFDGQLPPCLITIQRHVGAGAFGYYSNNRFINTTDPQDITDEIALNPLLFAGRTPEQILSTLACEMVTLWQHHFGTPSCKGYHDRQWAAKMRSIGLMPSVTGKPGGKTTGKKMSHYIEEGGRFAVACAAFLAAHPAVLYHDRASEDEALRAARKKSAASKTKFTCPDCGAKAWGKPDLLLICGACQSDMTAEAFGEEDAQTALQSKFGQAVVVQDGDVTTPDIPAYGDVPHTFVSGTSPELG